MRLVVKSTTDFRISGQGSLNPECLRTVRVLRIADKFEQPDMLFQR